MASGEGSKRTRDAKPADRTGGGAPDGLTPGDERVAKRASRKGKPERKSRVLPLSIALVAFAGAAAIVWYGKGGFPGGVEGEVPIVTASETPDRVAPEEPGGLKIPFQDNAVLNNGEPAEPKVERILPPPEEPMEIARPARPEPSDDDGEPVASAETSQESHESTTPLVPLNNAEEASEESESSAETAAASDEPAADSDPIGALVERMSEGQSADSDSAKVETPPAPPAPQVAASKPAEPMSSDASDVESETPPDLPRTQRNAENENVVQAQVSREVGEGVGGRTKVEGAESLMAKSAQQSEANGDKRSADASGQPEKTDKKTRSVSIVVPPNVPTIDVPAGQSATQQASDAAPAQQQSPAPQVAKASPAVVTKEVEQPGKKTNGEKVETLPTEQKSAESIQVAQPRMADLPKNSYIIQVAALRSEAEAKGFWSTAQAKHPDLLETMPLYVERADLGDQGIYFRVQTGPFPSKATAQDLCGQLKSAGQDCIVKRRK